MQPLIQDFTHFKIEQNGLLNKDSLLFYMHKHLYYKKFLKKNDLMNAFFLPEFYTNDNILKNENLTTKYQEYSLEIAEIYGAMRETVHVKNTSPLIKNFDYLDNLINNLNGDNLITVDDLKSHYNNFENKFTKEEIRDVSLYADVQFINFRKRLMKYCKENNLFQDVENKWSIFWLPQNETEFLHLLDGSVSYLDKNNIINNKTSSISDIKNKLIKIQSVFPKNQPFSLDVNCLNNILDIKYFNFYNKNYDFYFCPELSPGFEIYKKVNLHSQLYIEYVTPSVFSSTVEECNYELQVNGKKKEPPINFGYLSIALNAEDEILLRNNNTSKSLQVYLAEKTQ